MSRSPERISSYRRHFEDSSSSSYQVRVSSPSPTRRDARHASAGYSCRDRGSSMRVESVGRRTVSAARRTRMVGAGVSAGAMVCVGPSGEPAIDLDVAAAENHEFLNTRTSERQEMVVLNDRLAVYIDKVRSLEQQNKLLETEIEAYQNRFEKPSGLRLLYEEQLRELKKIADQMRVQRDISLAAKESTAAQLQAIKIKYEEAMELRRKAELDIEAFRPDVDNATSSRIALEKKLEQLEVEIEFLKRVHQQEIDELMKQIYAAHASAQSAFSLPDLAAALKQIQTQYDDIAAKNLQEMDSWYKNKFEDITSKSSRHVGMVRSIREEIAGAKKDIQSKERDLDTLRTRNEALEAQIRETQEKYRKELEELQARIEALQLELKSTKEKIALHLREYQDLLNVKMSLEIEITTYRKLIEGEDLRLSGMMQTLSLTSCSTTAIGAGMSFSGGGIGGAGGMGGGLIGGSGGGVADMAGGHGLGAGSGGGGVGAGAGRVGTGGGSGGMGAGGISGVGSGVGSVGAGRLGTGAGGEGTGAGGEGTGAGGVGTGAGGVGAGGVGTGAGGVGAGGVGTGTGGVGASVGGNLRFGTRGRGDSGVGAVGIGAGGDAAGSGGMGGTGMGFSGGNGVVGGGTGDGIGGGFDRDGGKDRGMDPAGISGGIRVGEGRDGVGAGDVGALSGVGGKGKIGGGLGDTRGAGMGYGSDGYDANNDAHAEQAVELTERRTVLIRTVKNEDDVLETDHQEQTYTITGAADDSDDD
ncbi:glial fibrillary acidic protein isoform X1 [Micropterus salmoides]|uniref:glial fibrillary acidic protein isoform X1 n=2 Tax=Micropterus salmoides TaxID=27706 RepID=UPI0018EC6D87|nr:glial fibrillary acidic protein isoform X1 [Micropterus salmoides]